MILKDLFIEIEIKVVGIINSLENLYFFNIRICSSKTQCVRKESIFCNMLTGFRLIPCFTNYREVKFNYPQNFIIFMKKKKCNLKNIMKIRTTKKYPKNLEKTTSNAEIIKWLILNIVLENLVQYLQLSKARVDIFINGQ